MKNKKERFFPSFILQISLMVLFTISVIGLLQQLDYIDIKIPRNVNMENIDSGNFTDGIDLKDGYTYKFSDEIKDKLSELWVEYPNSEYHLCLDGKLVHDNLENQTRWQDADNFIIIDEIIRIVQGKSNYVTSPKCEGMIHIHNHPEGPCSYALGVADANVAKGFFEDGGSLFMIQCSQNNFEMYTRRNLYEPEIVKLQ